MDVDGVTFLGAGRRALFDACIAVSVSLWGVGSNVCLPLINFDVGVGSCQVLSRDLSLFLSGTYVICFGY